jgi:hypothetical protein
MFGSDMSRARRQAEVSAAPNPIRRVLTMMSQLCCSHSYIRRGGGGRLRLECTDCGYTTPGIETSGAFRASTVNVNNGIVNSLMGRFH